MTCALCSQTTWLMFTMAPSVKGAAVKSGPVVLCHGCHKRYRDYEVELPVPSEGEK